MQSHRLYQRRRPTLHGVQVSELLLRRLPTKSVEDHPQEAVLSAQHGRSSSRLLPPLRFSGLLPALRRLDAAVRRASGESAGERQGSGVDKVIALMHDMEAEFDASSFVEWDYLYDSRGRAKMSFLDRMVDAANPSEPQKMSSKFARMDTQTGTNCGLTFDWTPQRWLLLPSPSDEGNPAHILMLSLGNVDSLVQIQLNDDGPTLLEVPPGMVIFPIVSQTGPKGFIAIKTPTEKELTESFNIKPEDINTVCVGE